MTTTYNHTSFPTQQLIYPPSAASQLIGLPIPGARVFTYSSLNHADEKTTYQTNSGSPPPALPNPVVANAIGQVTIYWALDDTAIDDLYYVEIKGPEGDDTLYYSYDNFDGAALIGVQPSNDRVDFNFIRNPQFTWNRFKPYPAFYNLTNEIYAVPDGVFVADDWKFRKSNSSATEKITITPFTLGQTTVDFNPVNYLSWNITTGGAGETDKCIFQTYDSVQTLSGQQITFQIEAQSSSNTTVTARVRQYFGTGGSPSPDVVTTIGSFTLSASFSVKSATVTIPPVLGKTLGTSGGDMLMLELAVPNDSPTGTIVNITNCQMELGVVTNAFQYETPEGQRSKLDQDWFGVPTGDIKASVMLIADSPGWVTLSGGTIGNRSSTATAYANEDAYALFSYLYANTIDANCPVSGGRSGNALTDFNANKKLQLPVTQDSYPLITNSPDSADLCLNDVIEVQSGTGTNFRYTQFYFFIKL